MELTRHRVVLRGDRAYSLDEYAGECPVQILDLGLESSYGSHVLDIDLQDGWAGLAVVGYFDNGEDCADSLLNNGVMEVPPSASKNPGTHTITFTGSDSEGYRVSTKIPYRILPKGCTTGSTPPPDPDVFQQFVEQLIAALDNYFVGGNLNDVWTKLTGGKQGWAKPQGGGGGGTSNYNDLSNKPRINGNEMIGNKTWQQLGFPDVEAFATAAAQSAQEAQTAAGSASSAASTASGSATAAQGSASTASTKAGEAEASAQAAAQSASAAEQSKTAADQSAQQAADSAGAADKSATAAAGSASDAANDAKRAEAAANKIPTPAGSADAGKFLAVNPTGNGYILQTGGGGEISFSHVSPGEIMIVVIPPDNLPLVEGYVESGILFMLDGKLNKRSGPSTFESAKPKKNEVVWEDVSGNKNDPVINSDIADVTATGEYYISVSRMQMKVPDSVVQKLNSAYTIEVLVNTLEQSSAGTLVSSAGNEYPIKDDGTGKKLNQTYGTAQSISSGIRHIAAVWNGTEIQMYYNGAKNGSAVSGGVNIFENNFMELFGYSAYATTWTNKAAYAVRIYDRALSEEEIQSNFLKDRERFGGGSS